MAEKTSQKLRLLVVDDEANILKSLRRLFRNDPFELNLANSAEEALQVMASTKIHVLLSDNKMPNMTGLELIKEVKGLYPDSIRMLFSGESDMTSVLNAVNQGEVYRFILKPWNDQELKVSVNLALAHWKLNNDLEQMRQRHNEMQDILRRIIKKHPELEPECSRNLDCNELLNRYEDLTIS
ncbi:MAG: response regulator [bacterium]|nr:response regulator [bacterium]